MLSPKSQPVLRPLYNGGRIVLQGIHHHLHSMLLDTLTLVSTNHMCKFAFFCKKCGESLVNGEATPIIASIGRGNIDGRFLGECLSK